MNYLRLFFSRIPHYWKTILYDRLRLLGAATAALCATIFVVAELAKEPIYLPGSIRSLPTLNLLAGCLTGGGISGMIFSSWLGRGELAGWLLSAIASLGCTMLTAAIAGTFVSPGIGTILGLFYAFKIFSQLDTTLVWVLVFSAAHLWMKRQRRSVEIRTQAR